MVRNRKAFWICLLSCVIVLSASVISFAFMGGDDREPANVPYIVNFTSTHVDGAGKAFCNVMRGQVVLDPARGNAPARILSAVLTAEADFEPGYPMNAPRIWLVDPRSREIKDTGWIGKAPDGLEKYTKSDYVWVRATISPADNKTWGEVADSQDIVVQIDLGEMR